MKRRSFLQLAGLSGVAGAAAVNVAAAAPMPWPAQDGDLKITSVRIVRTRPRRPLPSYTPTPGSWSTGDVEVANPVSVYPKYKATRSLFQPDPGGVSSFTVEIGTDQGLKGYGRGGPAGGPIVEGHLKKLLLGENPLNIERLWDIIWRSSMSYGRKGAVINAISGVDLALWDLAGKVWGLPVYKLLGGETKARIPSYCTGNDIDQHIEFGYTKLKLALPHGPADGREGIKKNVALVKRTREALGPEGEIMMDCWMALTERYTLDLAEAFEPYAASRLRRFWTAAGSDQIHPNRDRRTRIHALRLPAVAGESLGGNLATRHPLVRRHDRAAPHWGARGGLRHSRDSARRRPARRDPLRDGSDQQPLGRNVHARAGRPRCGLRTI
jgi:hypothetical protein